LAGGTGSRLFPLTTALNKHLLPVYDKPMIFYSLSALMLSGISEILIITSAPFIDSFKKILGNGEDLGISIKYAAQDRPAGIPEAFLIGEKFLDKAPVTLVLGDNFFFGANLRSVITDISGEARCTIFLSYEKDPSPFGIAELDQFGKLIDVYEKPINPISNYAITGFYCFDEEAPERTRALSPSDRGELEITDLIRSYAKIESPNTKIFNRAITWMDLGTPERILEASNFVQLVERHSNQKICVPEEIAWRNGWIDTDALTRGAGRYGGTPYADYLRLLPELHQLQNIK